MMCNTSNPAEIYTGTTWEKIESKFLLGSGSNYSLGSTGGASTVKLTIEHLPAHTHNAITASHVHTQPEHHHGQGSTSEVQSGKYFAVNAAHWRNPNPSSYWITSSAGGETTGSASPITTIESTGKGTPFSIIPPYLAVNIWKRLT